MAEVKKAHCPAPRAVVAACDSCAAEMRPQSPAKSCAALIAEGLTLVADAKPGAPKLVDACRSRYPRFDDDISTHVPAAVRERARHLKRTRAFASLQELYLEAILASLTKRGFMSPSLEPTAGPQRTGP